MRLRGSKKPQLRLPAAEIRVLDDVTEAEVQILATVAEAAGTRWLAAEGVPDHERGRGEGEG